VPNWITRDEFLKGKQGDLQQIVVAQKAATKSAKERTIPFIISSKTQDRHGDTIKQGGWLIDNYLRNPVVQWAHDGNIPAIAQAPNTKVRRNKELFSEATFASQEEHGHEFAEMIYRLVEGDFIRGASVGFRPITWEFRRDPEGMTTGVDYIEQELLEWSVCNVPSNPDGLLQARSAGINIAPMYKWAESVLDLDDDRLVIKLAGCSRDAVDKARKDSDPKQRVLFLLDGFQTREIENDNEEDDDMAGTDDVAAAAKDLRETVTALAESLKMVVTRMDAAVDGLEDLALGKHAPVDSQPNDGDHDTNNTEKEADKDAVVKAILAGIEDMAGTGQEGSE